MNKTELAAEAMKAILSSEFIRDFIADGRGSESIDKYQAVAIESIRYAKALIEELDEGWIV